MWGALLVAAVVALILLGWASVRSRRAWRLRKASDELESYVAGADRYVDMGVVLHVVDRDPLGEPLVAGAPPLRILRSHRFGGLLDRRTKSFCGPSMRPVVWYCSEQQEPLILHRDDMPDRIVARGAMGAGKTQVLAMRLILRVLFFTGFAVALGATAPTSPRLAMIREAVNQKVPADWIRWSERRSEYVFANGIRVQLVSTHQQSEAGGSPIQGFNWADCSSDEMQDSLAVDSDIEARGRSAPGGRYRRFCSVTSKDSSDYRTWVDFIIASGEWAIYQMKGPSNPFTHLEYWEKLARTMDPRAYKRKVLAEDVGPERQLYSTWERAKNLWPVPLGATDVTSEIMARWGRNITILIGHDPGKLHDVSVLLKAYRLPRQRQHVWFVVDEVTTDGTTTEEHVHALLRRLRERWQVNDLDWKGRPVKDGPIALVRADPYSNSGAGDVRPDRSVYTVFRQHGLIIHPAAYVANATKAQVGNIPKEGRIDMVRRLLCSAVFERRLFVACNDNREPAAPFLVKAFEAMERDASGKAEGEKKDLRDKSHWPAAVGYALWALERPRLGPGADVDEEAV